MQLPLFAPPPATAPPVELVQHSADGYAQRTAENARKADLTVAFAVDFSTAGEKLTRKVAGERFIAIAFGSDPAVAAQRLATALRTVEGRTLNVAGNGLATLSRHGVSQAAANRWVLDVLTRVRDQTELWTIRSGGQTGVDTAGLVAGVVMGVPVVGLYPAGFRQRLSNGMDVTRTASEIHDELQAMAAALRG